MAVGVDYSIDNKGATPLERPCSAAEADHRVLWHRDTGSNFALQHLPRRGVLVQRGQVPEIRVRQRRNPSVTTKDG